jgi:hypothetical protein
MMSPSSVSHSVTVAFSLNTAVFGADVALLQGASS